MNAEVLDNLRLELRRGCLTVAVLAQLRDERYGYTLRKTLAEQGLEIDESTLYPLLRRLESDLGLPPGTPPEQVVAVAARRRGVAAERHLPILTAETPPGGAGPAVLLRAIHELDSASRELLPQRVTARQPVRGGPA